MPDGETTVILEVPLNPTPPPIPDAPALSLAEQWERDEAQAVAAPPPRGTTEAEFEQLVPEFPAPLIHGTPLVPTQKMIDTVRALGLDDKHWTLDKIRQLEMLEKVQAVPIVARVLLITGLDGMSQIQKSYKVLGEIADNEDLSKDVRVAACKAIAETAKSHRDLSAHALALAKETEIKKASEMQRVLPPNLNLQMNFPPGTAAPSIQVESVNSGQEHSAPSLPP